MNKKNKQSLNKSNNIKNISFWKRYSSDFSWPILGIILISISIFIIFSSLFKSILNDLLINPIISKCSRNVATDLVLISFFISSIIFLIYQLYNNKKPTLNSLVFSIGAIIIYFVYFKYDNNYTFYSFSINCLNSFKYAPIFLLSLLFFILSYGTYLQQFETIDSKYSLLDDNPNTSIEDSYKRTNYSDELVKYIQNTNNSVSFAISISGEWGSGKSDFLNRLRNTLSKDGNNIILDFNPWIFNKSNAIAEEFFKLLASSLKAFNHSLIQDINEYSIRILRPARETHFKFLDAVLASIFKIEDIKSQIKNINTKIKLSSKKIIVFIDDMDRLSGIEIMETLRLIRNTANFNNVFFIVAIDQNYIVKALNNANQIENGSEYLKKIFQLNISLPAFKKDLLLIEFKNILLIAGLNESETNKIIFSLEALNFNSKEGYHPPLFQGIIENIRDLKRFYNSFIISYNILKDEIEISDLIVIELIRNKNINMYNAIRDKTILENNSNEWKLKKTILGEINLKLSSKDQIMLEHALNLICSNQKNKNLRRFSLPHNFYLYFSYQLFELISFKDFNILIDGDEDQIFKAFEIWINENKENELHQVISNIEDYKDLDTFKNIVCSMLRVSSLTDKLFRQCINLLFIKWKSNHDRYFNRTNEGHRQFLFSIFANTSIRHLNRAYLAYLFLNDILRKKQDFELMFTSEELTIKIFKIFEDYLDDDSLNKQDAFQIFYMNKYLINDFVLYPQACIEYKKFLLSNDNGFVDFIKKVVRRKFHSDYEYSIDPCVRQIFSNIDEFLIRLNNFKFNDEKFTQLRDLLKPHINLLMLDTKNSFRIEKESDRLIINELLDFNFQEIL